jgi:hypothetical protein
LIVKKHLCFLLWPQSEYYTFHFPCSDYFVWFRCLYLCYLGSTLLYNVNDNQLMDKLFWFCEKINFIWMKILNDTKCNLNLVQLNSIEGKWDANWCIKYWKLVVHSYGVQKDFIFFRKHILKSNFPIILIWELTEYILIWKLLFKRMAYEIKNYSTQPSFNEWFTRDVLIKNHKTHNISIYIYMLENWIFSNTIHTWLWNIWNYN